jgi:hypothetical protein
VDAQSGVSVGGENKALDTRSRPSSSASRRRGREGGRDRDPKPKRSKLFGKEKNLSEFF